MKALPINNTSNNGDLNEIITDRQAMVEEIKGEESPERPTTTADDLKTLL